MVEVGSIIQGGNNPFINFLRFDKTNRIIGLRCFVRFRNTGAAAIIRLEILDTQMLSPNLLCLFGTDISSAALSRRKCPNLPYTHRNNGT